MDIEVKRNSHTQGWCADFTKNGRKYYADVSWVQFCGPECMIFAYDKDGHIDWSGVYSNRQVSVSKETLLNCIKDFMEADDENPRLVEAVQTLLEICGDGPI